MRVVAYAAMMCAALSGVALPKDLLANVTTPTEKLGSIYVFYLKAQQCSTQGLSFKKDDVEKITASIKQYAEQSGVPKLERDEQWENAKKRIDIVETNTDQCSDDRAQLSELFPDVLPKINDNPF